MCVRASARVWARAMRVPHRLCARALFIVRDVVHAREEVRYIACNVRECVRAHINCCLVQTCVRNVLRACVCVCVHAMLRVVRCMLWYVRACYVTCVRAFGML